MIDTLAAVLIVVAFLVLSIDTLAAVLMIALSHEVFKHSMC